MNPAMSALEQGTVLLGICGGVAAYKAVEVASGLRKAGWSVHVAMSAAAQKFVGPVTFAAVTAHPVLTEQFPDPSTHAGDALFPHLYPATRADLFVLLPATADMMAKIAHGLGDDPVSAAALSLPASCRRVFCPAMNVEMWRQPVIQENVKTLEARGWERLGPASGELACGMTGEGRMTEPAAILEAISRGAIDRADLRGRTVLVISGPTHEHFDPVRFIGNPSSGKMGRALADEARAAGARVIFVTGPVADENLPRDVELHRATSADDLLAAARAVYEKADVVIYAAAVADYKPATFSTKKLPKKTGPLTLELVATPDVSATLNERKRPGQVCIGFALQTDDGEAKALAKLKKKRLDGIVLNALDAMGGESGAYRFIATGDKAFADWGKLDKRSCARRILQAAASKL